jgi:hypothetical protein
MPELPLASGTETVTAKTADDINDLFKTLDDEPEVPEVKKEAKKAPKEEDSEGDDDDDKLDLIEPDEELEKLDLKETEPELDIAAPPRKKEILKKYPELFKEFPFLEKMLYRDKEYNELFGSFDDARELAEKAEVFQEFEGQLLAGNTEEILKNVRETDTKAFDIIVDDYLPTLMKVDKEAYFHVVGNLNKRLIAEMVKEANTTGNDDLKQAALLVNQFVFGTSTYTPPQNRVDRREDPEADKVQQERLEFTKERFESARDDLQVRVDNTLKATIAEYIDPKGTMSSYVKKNAVADAIRMLNEHIGGDSGTVKGLDKLWRAAFEAKFSKESLARIQSFYLGKARGGLKKVILAARAEALKDTSPREKKQDNEDVEETPRRGRIETGRTSQPRKSSGMRPGESVSDFFARD